MGVLVLVVVLLPSFLAWSSAHLGPFSLWWHKEEEKVLKLKQV